MTAETTVEEYWSAYWYFPMGSLPPARGRTEREARNLLARHIRGHRWLLKHGTYRHSAMDKALLANMRTGHAVVRHIRIETTITPHERTPR